ncbi:MAG: hypothetical protein H7144_16565 [Burkholderiales bacterium]|nr:hypothetical protein [Phycisphaerae bacterium]
MLQRYSLSLLRYNALLLRYSEALSRYSAALLLQRLAAALQWSAVELQRDAARGSIIRCRNLSVLASVIRGRGVDGVRSGSDDRRRADSETMTQKGEAVLGKIRSKAKSTGNVGVYSLADLPIPSTPLSKGNPDMPTDLKAEIDPTSGFLNLKWKNKNATQR